ncbi:uncharacterized protein LOC118147176 [Callithrix jacchus]
MRENCQARNPYDGIEFLSAVAVRLTRLVIQTSIQTFPERPDAAGETPRYQRTGGPGGAAGPGTRSPSTARLQNDQAVELGGSLTPKPPARPLARWPCPPHPRPAPPRRRGPGRHSRTKAGPRAGTQGRASQEGCQRPGSDPRPKSPLVPAPPGPTCGSAGLQAGPKPQPSFFRLNKIPLEPAASKLFYRGCRVGLKDSTENRGCGLREELVASAGTGQTPRAREAGGRRRSLRAAPPAATCPLSTKRVAQAQAGGRVPASVCKEERTRGLSGYRARPVLTETLGAGL